MEGEEKMIDSFQRKQLQDLKEWEKMILEQSCHWWTLWGLLLWKEKKYLKENRKIMEAWHK